MFIATLQSFKGPVVHFVLHERDRSRGGRRLDYYHPKNSYMFGMPYGRWTGQSQYENQEQKRTVSLLKMRKKVYTAYRTRNVCRSLFHETHCHMDRVDARNIQETLGLVDLFPIFPMVLRKR